MSRFKKHKLRKKDITNKAGTGKAKGMSKQMLMTLVIGGLMVLSIFGIIFSGYNSGREKVSYNGYEFRQTNEGWSTKIGEQEVQFNYLPESLSEIEIDNSVTELISNSKVIYVTFNPNSKKVQALELMRFEFGNSLSTLFGKFVMNGVTEKHEKYSQPIVNCMNATAMIPVVKLVESNETKARAEEGCLILEVDEYSAIALEERIVYDLLGILNTNIRVELRKDEDVYYG